MALAFWVRIVLTSIVVNVPLAVGLVHFGASPVVVFGYSAAAGAGLYLTWTGHRPDPRGRRQAGSRTWCSFPRSSREPKGFSRTGAPPAFAGLGDPPT